MGLYTYKQEDCAGILVFVVKCGEGSDPKQEDKNTAD